jgi:hypothetical protein
MELLQDENGLTTFKKGKIYLKWEEEQNAVKLIKRNYNMRIINMGACGIGNVLRP